MANIPASTLLPVARMAVGSSSWAKPGLTGALLGMKLKDNHEAVFMGRLFGVRDVALGAGVLASSGDSRKLWLRIGLACDVADAAAGVLGFREGAPKFGALMGTTAALTGIALGVVALREG